MNNIQLKYKLINNFNNIKKDYMLPSKKVKIIYVFNIDNNNYLYFISDNSKLFFYLLNDNILQKFSHIQVNNYIYSITNHDIIKTITFKYYNNKILCIINNNLEYLLNINDIYFSNLFLNIFNTYF